MYQCTALIRMEGGRMFRVCAPCSESSKQLEDVVSCREAARGEILIFDTQFEHLIVFNTQFDRSSKFDIEPTNFFNLGDSPHLQSFHLLFLVATAIVRINGRLAHLHIV